MAELLKALIRPLLKSKRNLPPGGLQMEVLVIVQEFTLLGTQGHERKTSVTAALVVQRFQGDLRERKCLRQSLRTFDALGGA